MALVDPALVRASAAPPAGSAPQGSGRRFIVPAAVGVGGLILGIVLGSSGGVDPTTTDEYLAVVAERDAAERDVADGIDDIEAARAEAAAAEAEAATALEELAALEASPDEPASEGIDDKDAVAEVEPEETFVMPDVVGMNLQLAQDTLQALGSYVMDQEDASGLDRFQIDDSNWQVCTQSPGADAVSDVSGVVTLSSVKLDEECP